MKEFLTIGELADIFNMDVQLLRHYDAKGLLLRAVRDNNPVVFIEHKALYKTKGEVPEEPYECDYTCDIKRTGKDVTIVTYSAMVNQALRAAEKLAAEGVTAPCEVDVLLTDDEGIHRINLDMRQVDRPTDVLSFPEFDLAPGEHPGPEDADPGTGLIPLGDMVLSMERVAAQAKEFGHSRRRELAYLVTHSVLHLLGYDHLDEGPMKEQMRAREEAVMALLGLER